MADTFSNVLDISVNYNNVPASVYRSFDFPGADDLGNMFQVNAEFDQEFCGARPISLARKLNPDLLTFEKWLTKNKDKIKLS